MNNKTKTALTAGALAVGVGATALFGLNVPDETTITPETTPIIEEIEQIEVEIPEEITETEQTEEDPLAPYRRKVEKDGVIIYYYEGIPPDLMPLLIKQDAPSTFSLRNPVSVTEEDLAIVDNYIFVQSANGMLYLSQLSHGIVEDERITESDLSGYLIYLNKTIECYDWIPFKSFAGTFYGNGNALYVMTVAEGIVTLTIDNAFAENFSGELSDLIIVCNSEQTPFIKTATGGKLNNVDFSGAVTYLIEDAENTKIDDCGIYITCNSAVKTAKGITIKNTIIENEMKSALLEVAEGNCIIENNIIASIIQGEPGMNCGAFVGVLKNEITLKNNLSQCVIDVAIGYGGHAIGYADYEYKDNENMADNYFESSLTVEGTESLRYIGNVDYKHIIPILEAVENFTYEDMAKTCTSYNNGGVATTVYNLALFPYGLTVDGELPILDELRAERDKQVDYDGYYEIIDSEIFNQTASLNGNTTIYKEDGKYYFNEPEETDEIAINNITYSDGSVIIFLNQTVSNKDAIITTFGEITTEDGITKEVMLTMSITNVTGETCFVEVPTDERITKVNVMLWDSLESMIPCCASVEKEVIQSE